MEAHDYLFENYPLLIEKFNDRAAMIPYVPLFELDIDVILRSIAEDVVHELLMSYSGQIRPDDQYILMQEFGNLIMRQYLDCQETP